MSLRNFMLPNIEITTFALEKEFGTQVFKLVLFVLLGFETLDALIYLCIRSFRDSGEQNPRGWALESECPDSNLPAMHSSVDNGQVI